MRKKKTQENNKRRKAFFPRTTVLLNRVGGEYEGWGLEKKQRKEKAHITPTL